MTPDEAMQHVRDDIAALTLAPTHSSCDRLHFGIRGYCQALFDSDVITEGQFNELLAEADAGLAKWQQAEALPTGSAE